MDQHGPTIKDAYKNHFLIGTAGDLPGSYSDQELGLVKETLQRCDAGELHEAGGFTPARTLGRFERTDALVKWCTGQ